MHRNFERDMPNGHVGFPMTMCGSTRWKHIETFSVFDNRLLFVFSYHKLVYISTKVGKNPFLLIVAKLFDRTVAVFMAACICGRY